MHNESINVLLIEDDQDDYTLVKELLSEVPNYRYQLNWKSEWSEGYEELLKEQFDICLIDYKLGQQSGLDLIKAAIVARIEKPIVILTGHSGFDIDLEAMQAGAVDYLDKSELNPRILERTIRYAIKHAKDFQQLKESTRLAAQMRFEKEAAQAANQAKSAFLANMSHEIRTPLGAVLGFIDLSLDSGLNDSERCNWLQISKRNAEHLLRLIDEVLDLSKVEADCLQIENSEFDLNEFLDELNSLMALKTQQKEILFESSSEGPIPRRIRADRFRLKQILINIIGNAIKFTERGNASISVAIKSCKVSSKTNLEFNVRDSGIGIAEADQEKLFQPFSQVNSSTARKYGGTGLGLILSKKIAQCMGGDLVLVESSVQTGSTFRLSIPMEASTESFRYNWRGINRIKPLDREMEEKPNLMGCRVLLVEDSPDNQFLVSLFLEQTGATVSIAENGKAGLEKALSEEFDVVLLDIQMPELDGYQTLKILKCNGYPRPVIALTAHALNEERDHAMREGFSDYLTKPIEKRLMYETLAKYFYGLEGNGRSSAASSSDLRANTGHH